MPHSTPPVPERARHSHPVYIQRSSLSSAGKQSAVLKGPAPPPSYGPGLEPGFATSPLTMGFHSCSPSISLSALLWGSVGVHGPGCLCKILDAEIAQTTRPVFLGWSVQGRKVWGKSEWGSLWDGRILTGCDRPA